ncbi:MAG: TatA/E family twin arginine-targeting protein translocase [Acidobacteriia bacterium]|nr:TatA/E family twin arginine-targeting protein translocase [Terriglobia bacterium]
MGPLGYPEMVFIFVLALLLFGPKKLPEIGRTLGKAMTEFRRASSELKATFDREMKSLEQETEPIKQAASEYHYDTYNYDYSSGTPYDHSYGAGEFDSTASHPSIPSASAPQGAELTVSVPPEGTVPHGSETAAAGSSKGESGVPASGHPAPAESAAPVSTTTEHQA